MNFFVTIKINKHHPKPQALKKIETGHFQLVDDYKTIHSFLFS